MRWLGAFRPGSVGVKDVQYAYDPIVELGIHSLVHDRMEFTRNSCLGTHIIR